MLSKPLINPLRKTNNYSEEGYLDKSENQRTNPKLIRRIILLTILVSAVSILGLSLNTKDLADQQTTFKNDSPIGSVEATNQVAGSTTTADNPTSSSTNNSSLNVSVNGQTINDIPQNGNYNQTISTPNSTTNININSSHSSSSSGSTSVNNSKETVNLTETSQ